MFVRKIWKRPYPTMVWKTPAEISPHVGGTENRTAGHGI